MTSEGHFGNTAAGLCTREGKKSGPGRKSTGQQTYLPWAEQLRTDNLGSATEIRMEVWVSNCSGFYFYFLVLFLLFFQIPFHGRSGRKPFGRDPPRRDRQGILAREDRLRMLHPPRFPAVQVDQTIIGGAMREHSPLNLSVHPTEGSDRRCEAKRLTPPRRLCHPNPG